jgi:hypothetical protein
MNATPIENLQAFGERFGLDVPTRYPEETHAFLNQIMALDSVVTPMITRMSSPTVWFCRGLATLLAFTSVTNSSLMLRNRLTLEIAVGLAAIAFALVNTARLPFLERCYLIFGGLLMVGNALMTQAEK